ncbi:ABC transporter permease [Chryseolinea sp. T2]|uniref:ABC transporter permease n=1 Tax=Chryseolinea sp. T2 TaxID=3129255 RepID=UPI003077D5E4
MPPSLAHRFFRWYCRADLVTHIEGDLLEDFKASLRARGARHARWRFIADVILLFRPGIIRSPKRQQHTNHTIMYRSYLKIAWRNLQKNRGFSLINVGGLALGMAVAILIGLWIHDELTFNTYYKNYKSIARVHRTGTLNGETMATTWLPVALGEELRSKYGSDFKHVAMTWPTSDHVIASEKESWSLRGTYIEPQGLEMFSLSMIEGSYAPFSDPHSIVLSKSAATTLFGRESAINKLVRIDNTMDAKVVGVYEDIPRNASFNDVQFFAPWDLIVSVNPWIKSQGFDNNFLEIYVQLSEHSQPTEVSAHIKDAILNNIQSADYKKVNPQLFLHPMEKWHLWADFHNGIISGLIDMVWLFGVVGVFVLILACINFMNLSTARAEKRAKEIGIRKAIGSVRSQLVAQFYSESFLIASAAFILAIVLVTISIPWLNDISFKQIVMPWMNVYFWSGCLCFIAITGILAGSYPAIFLSSFSATKALKGGMKLGHATSLPRKVLVITQFSVSVILILGTIVVYNQISYAKDRPIGYERNGLVNVQLNSQEYQGKNDALRNELLASGVVNNVGFCSSPPTDIWNSNGGFTWEGMTPGFLAEFGTFTVTPGYGETVGWQFTEGRDFNLDLASDSSAFVINEAAAKLMGFQTSVGKHVKYQSWWTNGEKDFYVIGVIKDQIMKSPYDPAVPSVYFLSGYVNWMAIRIKPELTTAEALKGIESAFNKVVPGVPIQYKFADQEYALKFATEERVGVLAAVFSSLAILISCLGLFALAAYVAEQRTKEIGIRKVNGASVLNLWSMLSGQFIVLVVISCVVAMPIAYYAMDSWLEKFTYRTGVSWWVYVVTGLGALAITLLTVSFQAVKAALMSPVKSLRSE